MGGNVSISRNRTKVERLLDWKEFTSKIVNEYDQEIPQSQTADNPVAPWGKTVGRFSFQCLTEIVHWNSAGADEMQSYVAFHLGLYCLTKYLFTGIQYE